MVGTGTVEEDHRAIDRLLREGWVLAGPPYVKSHFMETVYQALVLPLTESKPWGV